MNYGENDTQPPYPLSKEEEGNQCITHATQLHAAYREQPF